MVKPPQFYNGNRTTLTGLPESVAEYTWVDPLSNRGKHAMRRKDMLIAALPLSQAAQPINYVKTPNLAGVYSNERGIAPGDSVYDVPGLDRVIIAPVLDSNSFSMYSGDLEGTAQDNPLSVSKRTIPVKLTWEKKQAKMIQLNGGVLPFAADAEGMERDGMVRDLRNRDDFNAQDLFYDQYGNIVPTGTGNVNQEETLDPIHPRWGTLLSERKLLKKNKDKLRRANYAELLAEAMKVENAMNELASVPIMERTQEEETQLATLMERMTELNTLIAKANSNPKKQGSFGFEVTDYGDYQPSGQRNYFQERRDQGVPIGDDTQRRLSAQLTEAALASRIKQKEIDKLQEQIHRQEQRMRAEEEHVRERLARAEEIRQHHERDLERAERMARTENEAERAKWTEMVERQRALLEEQLNTTQKLRVEHESLQKRSQENVDNLQRQLEQNKTEKETLTRQVAIRENQLTSMSSDYKRQVDDLSGQLHHHKQQYEELKGLMSFKERQQIEQNQQLQAQLQQVKRESEQKVAEVHANLRQAQTQLLALKDIQTQEQLEAQRGEFTQALESLQTEAYQHINEYQRALEEMQQAQNATLEEKAFIEQHVEQQFLQLQAVQQALEETQNVLHTEIRRNQVVEEHQGELSTELQRLQDEKNELLKQQQQVVIAATREISTVFAKKRRGKKHEGINQQPQKRRILNEGDPFQFSFGQERQYESIYDVQGDALVVSNEYQPSRFAVQPVEALEDDPQTALVVAQGMDLRGRAYGLPEQLEEESWNIMHTAVGQSRGTPVGILSTMYGENEAGMSHNVSTFAALADFTQLPSNTYYNDNEEQQEVDMTVADEEEIEMGDAEPTRIRKRRAEKGVDTQTSEVKKRMEETAAATAKSAEAELKKGVEHLKFLIKRQSGEATMVGHRVFSDYIDLRNTREKELAEIKRQMLQAETNEEWKKADKLAKKVDNLERWLDKIGEKMEPYREYWRDPREPERIEVQQRMAELRKQKSSKK